MAAPTYLKVTLKFMALYAGIMAVMAVFFQDVGSFLFKYSLNDPLILRYWGGALFALAILYLFLSYEPEKLRVLLWVGVIDLSSTMFITIIHVAKGMMVWYQGIIPMIINPIFLVLILSGLSGKPEGEVLLMTGGEEEGELPDHMKHPLHGK